MPVPHLIRPGLHQVLALLVCEPSLEEVLAIAERLDLRDLSEHEIAYLENVSVSTVRKWRLYGSGRGPNYRNQGGVRYPIRWYLEWREGGRQKGTADGTRRGRREDLAGAAG